MKAIIYFFIILIICLLSNNSAFTQNYDTDKQEIQMLRDFYSVYNTEWEIVKDPHILIKKLDSLQRKYCTKKLREKIKDEFKRGGLDHDL